MSRNPPGFCALDDVIVVPDPAVEDPGQVAATNDAFLALSRTLAREPAFAVQRLVESAMKLTGAESAGVSLEDTEQGEPVFRWIATAGEYARYLNGTMPRHFSPCGTVVDRGKALVMRDPARHFEYAAALQPPIRAGLMVPFARSGKFIGTLWVVGHREGRTFTVADVRTVQNLTTFATSILDAVQVRHCKAASRK